MQRNWQVRHGKVIVNFLRYLNEQTNKFILKGGTALAQCYNLTRFSEDIDLDSGKENIISYVERFCKECDFAFCIGKDTPTVKRCFINYGNQSKPLKIETSYHKLSVPPLLVMSLSS